MYAVWIWVLVLVFDVRFEQEYAVWMLTRVFSDMGFQVGFDCRKNSGPDG